MMEQRDGRGSKGGNRGMGGSKGGNRAVKDRTGALEGWGADPLPPLPVLRPCYPSNLTFICDLTRHDLNCQVTCCSFIIKTSLDAISIIVVARCHDKINKFALLK